MAAARFGILGRLLLILLSAIVSLSATSLLVLRWQTVHHLRSAPFLRVKQFAADVDLISGAPTPTWPTALRALNGREVWLAIRARPPQLDGFIHAPRLEAKLHAFAQTPSGHATQVYTSPGEAHRDPRDHVEGFMALAVANLPGGRVLVATPVIQSNDPPGLLFGAPSGLWIGLCGAVVATLSIYGAAHEMRPLRKLARSLDAFEGVPPAAPPALHGAPEVRTLASAINAMQHRVSDLMHERTLMIGAISHDLRTFLTRLQLRVMAMEDQALRTRFAVDLDAMNALVEDALAFARGTDVKLARKTLDLADLVATEVAEREAVGKCIAMELVLSDALVEGDPTALRRVVSNLIDNASAFGHVRVRVTVARRRDQIHLSVEDDGPGVPIDLRADILKPFYRIESSRNRVTGGAGLGLAIASRIVEAHHGTLELSDSTLGGLQASVILPSVAKSQWTSKGDTAESGAQNATSIEANTVRRRLGDAP